jgi:hypothetical protein
MFAQKDFVPMLAGQKAMPRQSLLKNEIIFSLINRF